MAFRIPWAVFQFPKPKIWIQQANISRILDPDSKRLVFSRLPSGARVGLRGDESGIPAQGLIWTLKGQWRLRLARFSFQEKAYTRAQLTSSTSFMYYVKLSKRKYTFFLNNIVKFYRKKSRLKRFTKRINIQQRKTERKIWKQSPYCRFGHSFPLDLPHPALPAIKVIKLKWEIIWTGGLPHLPWVPQPPCKQAPSWELNWNFSLLLFWSHA